MNETTFDIEKALSGVPVRCREPYFTPEFSKSSSLNSPYALVGGVTCAAGSMAMCWRADGSAVRQAHMLFKDHADSDFDLLLVE